MILVSSYFDTSDEIDYFFSSLGVHSFTFTWDAYWATRSRWDLDLHSYIIGIL